MYFDPGNSGKLKRFYANQIEEYFFPYWNSAVDRVSGGIFNCFDNAGTKLVSRNKYTWSQGRFVWIWSRLYELNESGAISLRNNSVMDDLRRTVGFIEKHAFMENGNCVFLTDEKGKWLESIPGKGYDTSFYADCFVVLGFAAYARVFQDNHFADVAYRIYERISQRIAEGNLRSEPYPIPTGYRFHSVPMIMLNVTEELALTLDGLGDDRRGVVDADSVRYMKEIMEEFYDDMGRRIIETRGPGGAILDNVLCRHVNPGHAIEDLWFVMELASRKKRGDYIEKAAAGVKSAINMGWDNEFGGLFRFVDASGGKPKGRLTGDAYETLILDTWDTKLWWPHSEMLYATLLAYYLTKDGEFVSLYNSAHEYVFSTFPDTENRTGEWVQIRDRAGRPINKVVALPVKDPYHIMRNMILMIELLEKA